MPDLIGLLRSKGFDVDTIEVGPALNLSGERFYAETVTRISHPERRAAGKIGLNYLAAVVGSRESMLPVFDSARQYARYGEERARVRVYVHENPWFLGRTGHYVSLCRADDMIVAQISILLRVQYIVVLAEKASETPFRSTAHFFDLQTNEIREMDPLRIVRGKALKPIP